MRTLLLGLLLALAAPAAASACSCAAPGNLPPPQMVVYGQVVQTTYNASAFHWHGIAISRVEVEVQVSRSWEQRSSTTVRFVTGVYGSDCGYDFDAGHQYLIALYEAEDGRWTAGACTPVLEGREAHSQMRLLGGGMQPLPSLSRPGASARVTVVFALYGLAIVTLVIGAIACGDAHLLGRRTGSA